jgi:hypothetical protein
MRLAALALAATLAGVPAAASDPPIWLGVVCDGPVPVGMQIRATRAAETVVTLDELVAFCASQAPAQPQRQTRRGTT